ncbi:isochorismatase family cysteine hydrolase [Paenibacillus xylaniclasticus]|uniref:isochorismatase family cysteine hydrolase n=1 Tax=Paenibacillus xylaniclasticus TaxID=588083 RepID=UPI000FDC989E|nr:MULTISPECIES: isochorismatase family cysteine hydrolase [Paenibacillus]GFN33358.1 hypothetical isochorismatase hydrolase [Paenibacillus curdlanolyticus]
MSYTSPEWEKAALIIIDTQNDFALPDAPAEIAGTYDAVPNMKRLVDAFRRTGLPVIHVVRLYLPDGSNVDLCRKSSIEAGLHIVAPGSFGADVVTELLPSEGIRLDAHTLLSGNLQQLGQKEWAMYKPRWGAFYKTPLERFLHEQGVSTLVFCGCNFPNCPRTSIYEASERDFRTVLATDAISGLYDRGAQELERIQVALETTDRIVQLLNEQTVNASN